VSPRVLEELQTTLLQPAAIDFPEPSFETQFFLAAAYLLLYGVFFRVLALWVQLGTKYANDGSTVSLIVGAVRKYSFAVVDALFGTSLSASNAVHLKPNVAVDTDFADEVLALPETDWAEKTVRLAEKTVAAFRMAGKRQTLVGDAEQSPSRRRREAVQQFASKWLRTARPNVNTLGVTPCSDEKMTTPSEAAAPPEKPLCGAARSSAQL